MSKVSYSIVALAAVVLLLPAAVVQAEVWQTVGYWQLNEATSGIIPSTGNPILDSSGNGLVGNGQLNPTWGAGLTGDPGDGAATFTGSNRVLITNNPALDLMLADLKSYRIEMDLRATDWYNNKGVISYIHLNGGGYGTEGYRIMLQGTSSTSDTTGRVQLSLWTDNGGSGVLWQPTSDPTIKYLPHYSDGLWHHIAVEIHPNADPAQTYVKFEIDGTPAGTVYNTAGWTQSNITIPVAATVDHFAIADPQFYNMNGFSGRMDNVKFSILVPEPSTFALLACGLFGLLAYAWRKRK